MEEIGVNMPYCNNFITGEKIEQPHLLSPLVLAYIGDAVYELSVRTHIVARGFARTDKIHSEAVKYVCANTQAGIMRSIQGMLTEEEAGIARRGRNAKSGHVPKGSCVTSYRISTGLECLVGYLYLKGNLERLTEIMEKAFDLVENGMVLK